MNRDQFLLLLSKKLSGDISTEEMELLEQVKSNTEYQQLASQLGRYFKHKPGKNVKTERLKATWAMIGKAEQGALEEEYHLKRFRLSIPNWIKVAAVFLLTIGAGLVIYVGEKTSDSEFSIINANNERSFALLKDGTRIWLNKKSSIRYNQAFGKQKREITLTGEAYFDVAKNEAVPLFIHAGTIDIEVKGTAFNVNAYQKNHDIQVALVHGLIQVSNVQNREQHILLHPNQKLIFSNETKTKANFLILPIAPLQLAHISKWTSDTLVFKREKLKDLAIQLEKKYELKIEIQSEQLKERRFSGTFTNETIQQALDALKLSYPLTYTIGNKLVIIKD